MSNVKTLSKHINSEQLELRQRRAEIVVKKLKELFPTADTVLSWSNPWELTVAVILSAQCTDKKVNEVTAELFKKYQTLEDYVRAKPEEFEQDIRSTGFYKNKTKNILSAARIINENFADKVPDTMQDLLTLPGVARKTANIILNRAYGKVEGVAVDTHVMRLSQKFQLTQNTEQSKIERDLMEILPKSEWMDYTYRIVMYGREYSPAHKNNSYEDPVCIELKKYNLL